MKGLIFNIQRYSIHDGGGIRTIVFFKGCPLFCPWCCNPESQKNQVEQYKIKANCIHCKVCCNNAKECPTDSIVSVGKYMTVDEVLQKIEKDMIFYNTSGGGVTLSGGEVLSQPKFALELLKKLKELSINTAMETSGFGDSKNILELSKYLDLTLFDLKIMDEKRSKDVLGADIRLIKTNLRLLIANNKKVIPRIPLIPGYTMDDKNINEIIGFVKELGIKEVHILPFHQYGSNKYEYLNKIYGLKNIKLSTEVQVNNIKDKMKSQGLNVVIGGI